MVFRNASISFNNVGKIAGFEVLIEMVIDVAIFRNIMPCNLYVIRCFGGTNPLHLQGRKLAEEETSVYQVARHKKVYHYF
jgi:hypothetical protein